ncbi:ChrR Cupin-like domain-containing protein [Paracoccus halophilus]|uniref:ChrR Cupin-like domain-containing protein n=2 Tax=Paracoccus halophilus TaxID=376733 RepID=A0A1I0TMZ3_9RHOB|nr:cupin domain-containing protein [Paracoccus halophilus]SFA53168.1 ChrR Cupin-like domain-containing protein [Paracoccus halophilus]
MSNEKPSMPPGAPKLEEILLQSNDMPWRAKSLKGVHEKMLWRDDESGASIALIKFEKGASIPQPHLHASNQMMFCLSGHYEYTLTGVALRAGSFYCNPKGNVHGPTIAHEETVVVEIYDGPHYPVRPDWYDNDEDAR